MPNGPYPVRLYSPDSDDFAALFEKYPFDQSEVLRRCVRLFLDGVKKRGLDSILEETRHVAGPPIRKRRPLAASKTPVKRKVAALVDRRYVSLSIFGTIPAGWPSGGDAAAVREVGVLKGTFPAHAFGLEVTGESMNKATGQFGPIVDGDVVVLLSPREREPQHGDIVAALCDGQTTLKRLWCKPKPCVLRAESDSPEWKDCIRPAHDLMIQGVVVGKI